MSHPTWTKAEARERALDLALQSKSPSEFQRNLEAEDLSLHLDEHDLDEVRREAAWISNMIPPKPNKMIPRIVGVVAVILGICALSIDQEGLSAGRYSPNGYGFWALILGIVLILKPEWASIRLK